MKKRDMDRKTAAVDVALARVPGNLWLKLPKSRACIENMAVNPCDGCPHAL